MAQNPAPVSRQGAPPWHAIPTDAVAQRLGVDPSRGLSAAEVASRLEQHGLNRMAERKGESGLSAFLRQYRDLMQVILVGAAVVNLIFTDELGTTLLLVGLTVFNAVLGLRGEAKAEASLAALEKMLKYTARVRRDGVASEIDVEQVAPGDIVLIEAGNRVPADGRLLVAATLEIEEAALTGESTPTLKNTEAAAADAALGDRLGMAFMNTSVTRGRGEMIVTSTGMATEMGHIADLLAQTVADKTPLQKQLDRLTVVIAGIAGVALLLMLALGARGDQSFEQLFTAGIALAISAIPTGLPAVVTTLYSLGTRVLASENAIVKRLPSVETLGSVSAICSDKTGTLTLNKMTARQLVVPGMNRFKVTGEGYRTEGKLLHTGGAKIDLDAVLLPMALCADARLDGENLIGDPTEGALIVLAAKGGIDPEGARAEYPRIAEVPFDSEYKFMATFHNMTGLDGAPVVRCYVKGAPDVLIARAGSYLLPGGERLPITSENRQLALDENERIARAGERVMVVAQRDLDPGTFDANADLLSVVQDLTLLAMVGIVDPPRSEAKTAIAMCKSAGIQVRMITGDHAVTAAAIGRELGIEGRALTGAEFASMSDEVLAQQLPEIGIVARVAPEDKIRLVRLLQEQSNVVAMTGDGVNDAPALKKADIGVAMGITGTEVSKEAAVMILTDDNFATIVRAVEYGRALYDNLSKYVRFQMESLVAFIAAFLGAAALGIAGGIPFGPLLVLWVNFAITVPIAIALGLDSPSRGLMQRKPRPLEQPVVSRAQWLRIIGIGLVIAIGTLFIEANQERDVLAVSMGATAFSIFSVFAGLASRDETSTTFSAEILADRRQVGLFGLAAGLTILGTELGFLQRLLGTTSLNGEQWLTCIVVAASVLVVDEVVKLSMRHGRSTEEAPASVPAPRTATA